MSFLTQLDLHTLFFALALVLVFLTVELLVVMLQNKPVKGVKLWVLGIICMTSGVLLWVLKSSYSSLFLKVVLTNTLVTLSIVILNFGVATLFQIKTKWFVEIGLMIFSVAVLNYYTFIDDSHPVRAMSMGFIDGLLFFRLFHFFFSQRKAPYIGRTVLIVALFAAVLALDWCFRGSYYLIGTLGFYELPLEMNQKTPFNIIFIVVCLLGMIGLMMSFISLLWAQSLSILDQEKKRVEIANRAKYDFLSNMSHELRTPLNSVIGFGRLLLDNSQLNPYQRSFVNIMVNAGKHQLKLINEILDFTKIDSGKFNLDLVPLNLKVLLNNVFLMVQKEAELKGVKLTHVYNGIPDFVLTDPVRLQQVLLNLLSNAIKFAPDGAVHFEVQVDPQSVSASSACLTFAVRDNGSGIPQDKLSVVQHPFEQVQNVHQQKGVGLGLSITRAILLHMRSELCFVSQIEGGERVSTHIESSPLAFTGSHGTVVWFKLTLPIESGQGSESHSKQHIISIMGSMPDILIVDDHFENREMLSQLLRSVNIFARQADSAAHALHAIESQKPDLLITDLRMPDISGFDLIQVLKQQSGVESMKIICSSATIDDQTVNLALNLGADAFLPKPVEKEELFNLLEALLNIEWRYESV